QVFNADTGGQIDAAFATLVRERPDAIFVSGSPLFPRPPGPLILLAAPPSVPPPNASRQFSPIGGRLNYWANLTDAGGAVGVYIGRILKGVRPADLPVMQASKLELVINAQAARVLGLAVPPQLIARADEVIE